MTHHFSLLFAAGVLLAAFAGCHQPDSNSTAAMSGGGPAGKSDRIAHGAQVNLADYAVPGKTTIFDFMSEYCPPCLAIEPSMHRLPANHADIVVVEVDINRPGVQGIDWQSPVALQYGIELTPQFKVYGPDRKLKLEGDEAHDYVFGLLGTLPEAPGH